MRRYRFEHTCRGIGVSHSREHRATIENLLVYDNVKNMEQYRELMGQLKALEHVEQELKSLLEKQEQIDD